jgi:hypothetical protein
VKLSNLLIGLFASGLILTSCAVREAPRGGPEDKTPPAVMGIEPADGSAMLPLDASFKITFSKAMQKENTEAAIFLSPVFWGYPSFKWSGRTLTIIPPENLKPNTTYILTIGAGAIDMHTNKLGHSQSYAFSTGSAIDSGAISGAIFSTDGQRIVYDIWVYGLGDTAVSNFWMRIPDYATQVDSAGGFKIEHLGNNRYLILAINDKNDDLFWDPSSEELGLPPGILKLTGGEQPAGVIFRPARRDTSTSYITRAIPLSSRRLAVEFSQQPVKELMLSSKSYRIRFGDSLLNFGTPYIGESGALILETDTQIPGQSYQLIPVGLTNIWDVPYDSTGIRFTGIADADTAAPRLSLIFPPDGSTAVNQDSIVELTFTKRIQVLTFPAAVAVVADSTDTLRFVPSWITPNQVRLRFPTRIPRERKIHIVLSPKQITDIFQNPMSDSALAYAFRLPPADTVGSVVAALETGQSGNITGILTKYEHNGETYQGRFNNSGELKLDFVMPGIYRFEFFDDSDSNGQWSPGELSPFRPAERFSFLPDTVKVRSRWSTDIGAVALPKISR